jgi:hypothetical protein
MEVPEIEDTPPTSSGGGYTAGSAQGGGSRRRRMPLRMPRALALQLWPQRFGGLGGNSSHSGSQSSSELNIALAVRRSKRQLSGDKDYAALAGIKIKRRERAERARQ